MKFVDSVLKVLGFETENKPNSKKKKETSKSVSVSYNLKEEKKPNDINGVPVFYCDIKEQVEKCITKFKSGKALIANFEECSTKEAEKLKEFLSGAAFALKATIKTVDTYVYLIIPEGVELEIEE